MSDAEPDLRVVDRRWWVRDESGDDDDTTKEATKPSYVADLEQQIADKDAQIREYRAKYRAASEEIDDARRRLRRELSKDLEREKRSILGSFLDVIDNLDRAIDAARGSDAPDAGLLEGVELVRRQFLDMLRVHGVQPIDATGEAFDPAVHDAVSMVPVTEPDRVGRVVDVVKTGYRVEDDILRPATVTVGQLADGDAATQSAETL